MAVASKNDPAVVEKAFERKDLLLRPEQVFPIEVHWNAKSGSVGRILETWNIAADSVIFVDDSPMELAEVAAAHPGIECVLFPKDDYNACLEMLRRLRDRCGKERVSPTTRCGWRAFARARLFASRPRAAPRRRDSCSRSTRW